MALTNITPMNPKPGQSAKTSAPQPRLVISDTPPLLADLSWLSVGALAVIVVALAISLTLLLRSLSGEVTMAWFLSRGAGIVGYLLISGAMVYGLMITTRTASGAVPAPVSFGMHEFISWLGLIFVAAHAVVLLWDTYIKYSLITIVVPFSSSFKPIPVGLGQLAFYASAGLIASFYARKRIGQKTWRLIHYASFATYLLATLHGILSGSDTRTIPMQAVYIGSVALVLFLTVLRALISRRARV
ncbi:MAG: hypothetical protein M1546_17975 [Chloroflexi bacterium]|nr:hypothetical protein [Chloroflexota bacterium]